MARVWRVYFYSIAEKTFLNRNSRACQTQAKLVTELHSTRELRYITINFQI